MRGISLGDIALTAAYAYLSANEIPSNSKEYNYLRVISFELRMRGNIKKRQSD